MESVTSQEISYVPGVDSTNLKVDAVAPGKAIKGPEAEDYMAFLVSKSSTIECTTGKYMVAPRR